MHWFWSQIQRLQAMTALPPLLTLIVVLDIVAYVGGLLYWYGDVMANPFTPMWAWPFIPDCPLFGLLGGMGLLMVTAQRFWSADAQQRAERTILIAGTVSAVLWISTYLPNVAPAWATQGATLAVWSWVLLLCGLLFRRSPTWLLALFAFGQIKYGLWTITAWVLFWRNTALVYGSPLFTVDSVFMTVTHIALLGQGIFLLTYFRLTKRAVVASFLWFAASDYVDYGLGFYPGLPLHFIPLWIMQWSTIAVTFTLSGIYFLLANQPMRKFQAGYPSLGEEEASVAA